jgi:transposase
VLVLKTLFGRYPFLKKLFADGGHQGPVFAGGQKAMPGLATEIVKRSDAAKGFEVLPRRWVVERTFAWLGRCRRLANDFENLTCNALAFPQTGVYPPHAAKALFKLNNFLDRLLNRVLIL